MSTLATTPYTPGTQKAVRSEGRVPATVYGRSQEPLSISVDLQDFRRAFRKAGTATLIDLEVESGTVSVLVQEIQQHPVSDVVQHVDFFAVSMDQKVNVTVPITFTGSAPAVRLLGGVLTTTHEYVHVRCFPSDLVHDIPVSVDHMERFHDTITLGDITLPEGLEMLDRADIAIAQIVKPRGVIEADTAESAEGEAEAA